MNDETNLARMDVTSRGYHVTGPEQKDGVVEVGWRGTYLFLTADDLRMMLDRIERGKK